MPKYSRTKHSVQDFELISSAIRLNNQSKLTDFVHSHRINSRCYGLKYLPFESNKKIVSFPEPAFLLVSTNNASVGRYFIYDVRFPFRWTRVTKALGTSPASFLTAHALRNDRCSRRTSYMVYNHLLLPGQ